MVFGSEMTRDMCHWGAIHILTCHNYRQCLRKSLYKLLYVCSLAVCFCFISIFLKAP